MDEGDANSSVKSVGQTKNVSYRRAPVGTQSDFLVRIHVHDGEYNVYVGLRLIAWQY